MRSLPRLRASFAYSSRWIASDVSSTSAYRNGWRQISWRSACRVARSDPWKPPWPGVRNVPMDRGPSAAASVRTSAGVARRNASNRNSTRSAPRRKAARACRSASAAVPAAMTAAIFVTSFLLDRLVNLHAEVAAALLEMDQDLVAFRQFGHGARASSRRDESNRLGILHDRRMSASFGFRLDEDQGTSFDLHPTDDRSARLARLIDH